MREHCEGRLCRAHARFADRLNEVLRAAAHTPIGAKYLAVQLASGWLSSLDYLHHTASLNLSQATPNPDGTLPLVVAPKDPGVANWLDTTGLHEGTLFVRWQ